MTAEIFLASFLGCWFAIIVTSVLFRTVYLPVQGWLLRRAFRRRVGDSGDLVSVGAGYVPCPLESPEEQASAHRQFEAQQDLCLAALDARDDLPDPLGQLVAAAKMFREATPPRVRKQMRAMAAFRNVQHAPDDPV
jgi:hypothetical protein